MTTHRASLREDILEYIASYTAKTGYPPSVGEIADNFHTVKSNVFHHLKRLEKEGFLTHVPRIARSWVLQKGAD